MKISRLMLAGSLVLAVGAMGLRAEEPARVKGGDKKEMLRDEHADHAQPKEAAQPETVKKPVSEVKVSDEAKKELAAVTEAYKKLTGLEVAGTLSADLLVGGQAKKQQGTFTGSFAAPNKFRHEMKDDVAVGSTGEKLYAYQPSKNAYVTAEAPKERVAASELPNPMRSIVQMQNVSLMCAIVDDAGKLLAEGMREVSKSPDAQVGGQSYTVLDIKGDKVDYRVLVDPSTHLLRQVVLDMKRTLEAAGRPDVHHATLTFDYTKVSPAAPAKAEAFAWAAPEGAKDVASADAEEGEAMALVGKEAPDFNLKGMDGKPVTMKSLRGSVVLLDFWATWCGPCKMSLPMLNKVAKDRREAGLKTFAIDLQEPKETVQPVAAKLIPDVPVLLDERGETSPLYKITGIPQTVVVGKDGKVRKVFIGAGPDHEAKMRAAVDAALKE